MRRLDELLQVLARQLHFDGAHFGRDLPQRTGEFALHRAGKVASRGRQHQEVAVRVAVIDNV